MTNIRNQCSWVHKDDMPTATQKAKDLVRMSVAKVALHEPLQEPVMKINQAALVIGGGVAGMMAARTLSQQGYPTHLVEKDSQLGGRALFLNESWQGEKVGRFLEDLIDRVQNDKDITVHLNAEIREVEGFVGNFKTTVQAGGHPVSLEHGVTIIACGASEYKPDDYLHGQDTRVLTGLELQLKLKEGSPFEACRTAVFVQCVGSRIDKRPYCSKVCCTRSIKSALELKALNPGMDIFILYRDLRSYGLREDLYRQAREQGIKFIRYNTARGIAVKPAENRLKVEFTDRVLRRPMVIHGDMLVLALSLIHI